MPPKFFKPALAALALVLLVAGARVQNSINDDRERLGLTLYPELKGAPPVLAFTTVALGGFRGLISNALWIRASDLQDDGKYFEMVQLADWITKLEPHFTQVWLHQAWNMAYNISIKFKDMPDRWRWVQRGIELLRDDGLRYNPNDTLIYRELAWFFQHKMGQNLDEGHIYYKQQWANEMSKVLGTNTVTKASGMERPDWDELLNPQTEEARERVKLLEEKYKMDPRVMKDVDDRYGPLEWRLPEASAIYWAALGLKQAEKNESRVNKDDLITLRRVIYQSMQLSFQRGRLVVNKFDREFEFGPNLILIPKVNAAYEQAMVEDEKNRDHIANAHRNFLRDAVFFLYTYNRERDAASWYKYLGDHYPNLPIVDFQTNSLPRTLTLDEYCIQRIQEEAHDLGREKTKLLLEGLERTAFKSLVLGEDEKAAGLDRLAQKVLDAYHRKIGTMNETRLHIPPLAEIKRDVLKRLLTEVSPEFAAQLRTKLGLPAPITPPETNAAPELGSKP
jgi:hypothetical protein